MIEAPLVGLEWCTNHLLENHETISQIDYNYIFRGNKLGYAPNRFSYPFLRTVILLFDMKKSTLRRAFFNEAADTNEGIECERPNGTMRLRFIASFLHSQRQYCEILKNESRRRRFHAQ